MSIFATVLATQSCLCFALLLLAVVGFGKKRGPNSNPA